MIETGSDMESLRKNLDAVKEKIRRAALKAGRKPEEIFLVAATKTVSPERISAAVRAGVTIAGENRIQEALPKIEALAGAELDFEWHFIGKLQRNKARFAVGKFPLIHSVDTTGLAEEIDRLAETRGLVQEILLEVNVSGEEAKAGFSPDDLMVSLDRLSSLKYVKLKGLMTIPPFSPNSEPSRLFFRRLKNLRDQIAGRSGAFLQYLSMGMSGDFETAIEEGATHVRIGRAIFGERAG